MLAEGDVDPAAGSRDEHTRLHVEGPAAERKQGFQEQVVIVLSLNSINWVPALPPTSCSNQHLPLQVVTSQSKNIAGHTWTPKE